MIKKFFFIFLVLFTIFFLTSPFFLIKAQDINETLEKLNNASIICEIGDKCCSLEGLNIHLNPPSLPFPFDKITEFGVAPVNFILDNTINKASGKIEEFLMSIFGVHQKTYCQIGKPSSNHPNNCYCQGDVRTLSNLCLNIKNDKEKQQCLECIGGGSRGDEIKGVWTAIGCVKQDLSLFIRETIFGWGIGLAGLISLFCIIYAALQMQTSQGSPEKIKRAQELLTSCIMGLMLIIFSVFILRLIGVNILKIPGFGG
jgi:hypothetical protein